MSSYNYRNKNDFDDMHIKHQTKKQFKDKLYTDKDRHKSKRSSFVDCFTNDSVIAPVTMCPPGVNCAKNKSQFTNDFHCPEGLHYSSTTYKCEPFVNGRAVSALGSIQRSIASNRKSAFFNTIVE